MANKVSVTKKTNSVVIRGKGARGIAGSSFLSGNGAPSNSLGNNGDTYLDVVSGYTYKKDAGVWTAEGAIAAPIDAISFTYEKQNASNLWIITHNLGFRPAVSVVDYGHNNVECDIEHVNENKLRLTFIQAGNPVNVSGYAYLS